MGDYILNYYNLCIAITIVFLVFMINPFIMSAMSIQYASASLICVDYSNNIAVAKINNCELLDSHFHRVDLFSELSRNMTPSSSSSSSSSDLFEDTKETEEGQNDVESNTDDNIQEQDAITSEESPESNDNDNAINGQVTNNK